MIEMSCKVLRLYDAVQAQIGYSESQLEDMLILRYLTFANIGRLTIERMQLLNNMAQHSQQLQMVEAWADRLKQNIKEEHRTYLESVTAGYLGVSSVLVLCCAV